MIGVRWLEQSQANVPERDDWFSPEECERLNGIRFAKRRADWRLGRWTAKRAASLYFQLEGTCQTLSRIEIRPAASGAPEVFLDARPAPVVISISHCRGTAVCAIAGRGIALGCDVESIEPRSAAFISDYFTPVEQEWMSCTAAGDRPRMATLIWSAKESALKALREGLRLDTRCVVAHPQFSGVAGWKPLRVCHGNDRVFQGHWRQTGSLLHTVVADPAPLAPVAFDCA